MPFEVNETNKKIQIKLKIEPSANTSILLLLLLHVFSCSITNLFGLWFWVSGITKYAFTSPLRRGCIEGSKGGCNPYSHISLSL